MVPDPARQIERLLAPTGLSVVGRRVERVDSLDMVLGRPVFSTDRLPDKLVWVKPLISQHSHAIIKRIDIAEALKTEGVLGVITHNDVPGINMSTCLLGDRPLLASDRVRCRGDFVAAIVAETVEEAEGAAELVRVDYEPLPVVTCPLDALKPHAPKIHENGNIAKQGRVRKGDVEVGFKEADIIVENQYTTPFQEPAPLEPEAGFAIPGQDGSVTFVGSMQNPFYVQGTIARILGLKQDDVRVIQAATGGSFGGKSDEAPMDVGALCSIAALKCGRPAAVVYSREESVILHSKRHPFVMRYKTGAKEGGKLTASQIELFADTGAHASVGPLVLLRALVHATGPYVVPHVKTDAYLIYTNNTVAGSFRGFGGPQVTFAAESQMDELANRLGFDPLDFRLKNILRVEDVTATGQRLSESVALEECAIKATKESVWYRRRKEYNDHESTVVKRGIGLSLIYHGNSLGPEGLDQSRATVEISGDATVRVQVGLTEYGTGARSGIAQVVAEALGVPYKAVKIDPVDTKVCPDSGGTFASRTLTLGGKAALIAAEKLREKLQSVAAELLDTKESDVNFVDGVVMSHGGARKLDFEEIVKECHRRGMSLREVGEFTAPKIDFSEETGYGTPYLQYTWGAVVAEVEVDMQLGTVKPLKIVTAYDVGRAVNPMSLEGQIEGGTSQALGYALMEELVHRNGEVMNPNLADYFLPTSLDMPPIQSIIVESPGPLGPYGVKAMGEPPIDGPAAALVNAIKHATKAKILTLPASPEEVLLAIKRSQAKTL